jgi:flagellar basal body-associated protein FliL
LRPCTCGYSRNDNKGEIMWTILLIVLLVVLLTGGGYGYSRRGRR